MGPLERMRRLFGGSGPSQNDQSGQGPDQTLEKAPRPRIDRRQPTALVQRAARLFDAEGRKVVVAGDGAVLRILLASAAAPQTDLLDGLRPLMASNAISNREYSAVRLHRLRPDGSLTAGFDVTALMGRLGAQPGGLRAVTGKTLFRAPAGPPLTRSELNRHKRARRDWPQLEPFYAPVASALQKSTAHSLRRLLNRPGHRCYAAVADSILQILVADEMAPQAAWLTSLPRAALKTALVSGDYDKVILRRLKADGQLSHAWNLTSAVADLRARPDLLDGDVAASVHEPEFRLGERSYSAVVDEYAAAKAKWPDFAAFICAPPLSKEDAAKEMEALARALAPVDRALSRPGYRLCLTMRGGDTLIALLASEAAPQSDLLDSRPAHDIATLIGRGEAKVLLVRRLKPNGRLGPVIDATALLAKIGGDYELIKAWLQKRVEKSPRPFDRSAPFSTVYFRYLETLAATPGLIDFIHLAYADVRNQLHPYIVPPAPPFDMPRKLPAYTSPSPKRRSVVFLHNNYYHFNHLTHALKQRGWDAVTVSLESPDSAQRQFMHGEDISLYDPDPQVMAANSRAFFQTVPERYGVVHFTGQGVGSFFGANFEASSDPALIPWDFMELRRHGLIIGFTPSGCLDGPRQSSIRAVSGGVCGRCVWELRPDVCSDAKNGAWARKLESMCDWVSTEGDWAVDERTNHRTVRRPITMALDPEAWRPDITPPDDMRVQRNPGEILIYHGVGNYAARRSGGRDIKGTGAVIAAIEALKADGLPVRLIFATDIPSTKVRFLQVQADIVVDQLNYGRHGANARESFMLGRPVVTHVDPAQGEPLPPLDYLLESPAIVANESTVYATLKGLIEAPDRWPELGAAGRAFALRWHDRDVCALRFERVIDRIATGLVPEHDEVFA